MKREIQIKSSQVDAEIRCAIELLDPTLRAAIAKLFDHFSVRALDTDTWTDTGIKILYRETTETQTRQTLRSRENV